MEATVADRDPDTIKAEIHEARERLAFDVDSLTVRANPQRIADDAKSKAVEVVRQPAVIYTLIGVVVAAVLLMVYRFRRF
jgi:Protein of unknown function (DUF3618)